MGKRSVSEESFLRRVERAVSGWHKIYISEALREMGEEDSAANDDVRVRVGYALRAMGYQKLKVKGERTRYVLPEGVYAGPNLKGVLHLP